MVVQCSPSSKLYCIVLGQSTDFQIIVPPATISNVRISSMASVSVHPDGTPLGLSIGIVVLEELLIKVPSAATLDVQFVNADVAEIFTAVMVMRDNEVQPLNIPM